MSKLSNATTVKKLILLFHVGDSCSFPFLPTPHYHYALPMYTKQCNEALIQLDCLKTRLLSLHNQEKFYALKSPDPFPDEWVGSGHETTGC